MLRHLDIEKKTYRDVVTITRRESTMLIRCEFEIDLDGNSTVTNLVKNKSREVKLPNRVSAAELSTIIRTSMAEFAMR